MIRTHRTQRIIVALDDPAVAHDAADALRARGHTVIRDAGARGAVASIARMDFDLVLLDVGPGTDGAEVAVAIRRHEVAAGRRTAIVGVTTREEDRDACIAAGMDGILPRPFERAELTDLVEWMGARRGASPGPPAADDSPAMPDPAEIMERMAGDVDRLAAALYTFERECVPILPQLETAARQLDRAGLERGARALRRALAAWGDGEALRIAGEIEDGAASRDREWAIARRAALGTAVSRLTEALRALASSLGGVTATPRHPRGASASAPARTAPPLATPPGTR